MHQTDRPLTYPYVLECSLAQNTDWPVDPLSCPPSKYCTTNPSFTLYAGGRGRPRPSLNIRQQQEQKATTMSSAQCVGHLRLQLRLWYWSPGLMILFLLSMHTMPVTVEGQGRSVYLFCYRLHICIPKLWSIYEICNYGPFMVPNLSIFVWHLRYIHHHQKAFRNKSHTSHGQRPGLKRNKSKVK